MRRGTFTISLQTQTAGGGCLESVSDTLVTVGESLYSNLLLYKKSVTQKIRASFAANIICAVPIEAGSYVPTTYYTVQSRSLLHQSLSFR